MLSSLVSKTLGFNQWPDSNWNATKGEHITKKELIKITDLLGRETIPTTNAPMFYIYEDGSVEKKIITN